METETSVEPRPRQILTQPGQQLTPEEIAEINQRSLMREEKAILVDEYHNRTLTEDEMDYVLSAAKPKKVARDIDVTVARIKAIRKAEAVRSR